MLVRNDFDPFTPNNDNDIIELGKKYSDSEHEVYATEDAEDGIILRQVRAGLIFKEGGKIIR
jgi:hypothetical protein